MPTGEEKNKLYFCKQGEEGNWHMLGEIKSVESLDEETVGMDMTGDGFSFDAKTVEFVMSARIPNQVRFQLLGVNVVNIIFCKDCRHRHYDLTCPLRKFDAVDDYDFCSRGERKWRESEHT